LGKSGSGLSPRTSTSGSLRSPTRSLGPATSSSRGTVSRYDLRRGSNGSGGSALFIRPDDNRGPSSGAAEGLRVPGRTSSGQRRLGGSSLSSTSRAPRTTSSSALRGDFTRFTSPGRSLHGRIGIHWGDHHRDYSRYNCFVPYRGYAGYPGYRHWWYNRYYNPYYYGYSCYPRYSVGFGFHYIYNDYPLYSTIYDPYPVYETYPVFVSSPAYIATQTVGQPAYVDNSSYTTYTDNSVLVGGGEMDAAQEYGVPQQAPATGAVRDTGVPGYDTQVDTQPGTELVVPDTGVSEPGAAPAPSGDMTDDGAESQPEAGLSPEEMHRLMLEGVDQFAQGQYDAAAQTFLKVAVADPDNFDAALAYAVARFATGDYEMSAIAIRRGVRRMPDVVNAPFDIRDRYGRVADFDRHLDALESHVESEPNGADGLLVLGFVYHFTGQRDRAADVFGRLKAASESDADLAEMFLNAREPEQRQTAPAPDVRSELPAESTPDGRSELPPAAEPSPNEQKMFGPPPADRENAVPQGASSARDASNGDTIALANRRTIEVKIPSDEGSSWGYNELLGP
jgi:hypothetical protein